LFALAIQLTVGASLVGLYATSLTSLSIAFAGAALAIAIFFLDADYFRGPAHPSKKDKDWPFSQSEIVTVTLADAGVFLHRAGGDEIYGWAGVSAIIERPLTLYLVLSPRMVVPLPKRAFMNHVHYAAFANFARARVDGAKQAITSKSNNRMVRTLGGAKTKRPRKAPVPTPAKAAPPMAAKPTSAPSAADLRAALKVKKRSNRWAAR
jgi:hypothetical protein